MKVGPLRFCLRYNFSFSALGLLELCCIDSGLQGGCDDVSTGPRSTGVTKVHSALGAKVPVSVSQGIAKKCLISVATILFQLSRNIHLFFPSSTRTKWQFAILIHCQNVFESREMFRQFVNKMIFSRQCNREETMRDR